MARHLLRNRDGAHASVALTATPTVVLVGMRAWETFAAGPPSEFGASA